ncbi:4Fe-4S binding protein [Clostridium sp. E02]|uniref:4Fe-4S binding protein n=1 Tax=Clostridium sp. E02 TaxID=2487134 RepID=UPI000F51E904|nr:4Fe-4S binding protein [Clostridium sp. E02]
MKLELAAMMKKIQPKGQLKKYVSDKSALFYASEKSKVGHNIPELMMQYGSGLPKFYLKTFPMIFSTIINSKKSYKSVVDNPKNAKTEVTNEYIEELIQYAKSLGAFDVGFTKVKPEYIFKGSSILHENAIVITMEMDKEAVGEAPSKITGHEVHRTYNALGVIVNKIAEFMRENGYSAQAAPALGGDVNYVLLAEKAGLGAIGNHGLLISPKVGPRQRIAAVYTSIENLPFNDINEHLWIKDFCKSCKKCVRACPSKAIFDHPIEDYNDTMKHIDYRKCAIPFSRQSGCSVCIKECTFNKVDYNKIKSGFIKK